MCTSVLCKPTLRHGPRCLCHAFLSATQHLWVVATAAAAAAATAVVTAAVAAARVCEAAALLPQHPSEQATSALGLPMRALDLSNALSAGGRSTAASSRRTWSGALGKTKTPGKSCRHLLKRQAARLLPVPGNVRNQHHHLQLSWYAV